MQIAKQLTPYQPTPLIQLMGVGPQIAKHLARLNLFTIEDLLMHFPMRYQDRTHIQPIRQTIPGIEAVVEGVITHISKPPRGKTKFMCEIRDESGRLTLRFFNIFSYQEDLLKIGNRVRCYHDVRLGQQGKEMVHPEIKLISPEKPLPPEEHLTPIYPATEGLSQYTLRKLTTNALTWLKAPHHLPDLLPAELLKAMGDMNLKAALEFIHRPPQATVIHTLEEKTTAAHRRLIFEELLAHRISLLHVKSLFQAQQAIALKPNQSLCSQLLSALPFQLTRAQARVVAEIHTDLAKPFPMLRLVQGDVGSGKTIVAALAMLRAVENGYQASLMAPTELLAEQHARNFQQWLAPLGVKVAYLSSNIKGKARKEAMASVANGEAQVVIGTHALFQQDLEFAKLALIVIDEQHRFGVHQRAMLREKGSKDNRYPHQLIMTATPIPRTLAMSFYADLDSSVIDELPPGRTPILTSVMASARREEVIHRIHDLCKTGHQGYWVCPLIEESEAINCQAATKTATELQQLLPDIRIGLVHGRMKAGEKETIMQAFKNNEIQILVATTVIEVGVDVPNASVMVIENAERLGLSQLHQLRGRVGRGAVASFCVLIYQYPISNVGKSRLAVMRETNDGFKIAQRDLELRGPGEVLGTRQTGELNLVVADLIRDSEIFPSVNQAADSILKNYPHLIEPLMQRWLGQSYQYGKV